MTVLEERILEIIAVVLDKNVRSISDASIRENLEVAGMDSIKMIQLMVILEEEYKIIFEEEDLLEANFFNAGRLANLLRKRLARVQ